MASRRLTRSPIPLTGGLPAKPIAALDANVLYPPSLRDLLLSVAGADLYEPRWSAAIQEEWTRSVLRHEPNTTAAGLEKTCRQMEAAFPDALVSGYEARIPSLTLPDPDDRHVLAAAIESGAAVIVTRNLSDFPAAALSPRGLLAAPPDDFLALLFDEQPTRFLEAVKKQRARLRQPPKSVADYLNTLAHFQMDKLIRRLAARQEDF